MNTGLRQQDLNEIITLFQRYPAIEEAILFGSRAKGNYKKGSDVDIAVKGVAIDHALLATLSFLLNEESATPYFYDIIHFDTISEKELLEHINRVGKKIYIRG